jgi:ABC-type methionine transport system permease subunit
LFHKEVIPQVEGKVFVNAAKASNEVVLECPNNVLGGIAAMGAGRYQLVVDVLFIEECLECGRAFIDKSRKFWL